MISKDDIEKIKNDGATTRIEREIWTRLTEVQALAENVVSGISTRTHFRRDSLNMIKTTIDDIITLRNEWVRIKSLDNNGQEGACE
jgi:hypothetical protein